MIKRLTNEVVGLFHRGWNEAAGYRLQRICGCSNRSMLVSISTCVLAVGLAIPAAAQSQAGAAVGYGMTPRRAWASMAVVMALAGAVIGGRALARAASRMGSSNGRSGAIAALVLGPAGFAGGGMVVATANGGLGTGNGLGGGVVAMLAGLTSLTLGWLALARSRRTS